MRKVIRLGDSTSHGGKVVEACGWFTVGGIPVARMGDKCTCSKKGHNNCVIVEGDPNWVIDGRPVALEGHKTSCGAVLISSAPNAGREDSGGGASFVAPASQNSAAKSAFNAAKPTRFDEQIQFMTTAGQPYANTRYLLNLANGETIEGQTDPQGNTARVVTDVPTAITQAELYFGKTATCCAQESDSADPSQIVPLHGVETNQQQLGVSRVTVTPEGESRPLTVGEIAMSRLIFKDAIDYGQVKVHNHEFIWFGLQKDDTAITPNGELYFNPNYFMEDFSAAENRFSIKLWFIHEMVHVWQHQLKYPVLLRGALRIGLGYEYTLALDKQLSDYNMEAQGNLLADYWALKTSKTPPMMYQFKNLNSIPLFEKVLRLFIQSPADKRNLPGGGNVED